MHEDELKMSADEAFELSCFLNDIPWERTQPAPTSTRSLFHGDTNMKKNLNRSFSSVNVPVNNGGESVFKSPFTPVSIISKAADQSFAFTTPLVWGTQHTMNGSRRMNESMTNRSFHSDEFGADSALYRNPVPLERFFRKMKAVLKDSRKIAFSRHWWVLKSYKRFLRRLRPYLRRKYRVGIQSSTSTGKKYLKAEPSEVPINDVATKKLRSHAAEMARVSSVTHISLRETIVMPVVTCIKILASTQAWVRSWQHRRSTKLGKWDRNPAMALYDHVSSCRDPKLLGAGTETWLHDRLVTMLRYDSLYEYFHEWCLHVGFSAHARLFFKSVALRRGYSALYLNVYKKKKKPWTRADHARYECMIGKFRSKLRKWKLFVKRQRYIKSFESLTARRRLLKQLKRHSETQIQRRFHRAVGSCQYTDKNQLRVIRMLTRFREFRLYEKEKNISMDRLFLRSAFRRLDNRTRVLRPIYVLLRRRKREIWNIWRAHYYFQQQQTQIIVDVQLPLSLKKIFWDSWLYSLRSIRAERQVLSWKMGVFMRHWRKWIKRNKNLEVKLSALRDLYASSASFLRAVHTIMRPTLVKCFDALKKHATDYMSNESLNTAHMQWRRQVTSRYLVKWHQRMVLTIGDSMLPNARVICKRLLRQYQTTGSSVSLDTKGKFSEDNTATRSTDKAGGNMIYSTRLSIQRRRFFMYRSAINAIPFSNESNLGIQNTPELRILVHLYIKRWYARASRQFLFGSIDEAAKALRNGVFHRLGMESDRVVKGISKSLRNKNSHKTNIERLTQARIHTNYLNRFSEFEWVHKGDHSTSDSLHVDGGVSACCIVDYASNNDGTMPKNKFLLRMVSRSTLDHFCASTPSAPFNQRRDSQKINKRQLLTYFRKLKRLLSEKMDLKNAILENTSNLIVTRRRNRKLSGDRGLLRNNSGSIDEMPPLLCQIDNLQSVSLFVWFDRLLTNARARHLRRSNLLRRLNKRFCYELRSALKKLSGNAEQQHRIKGVILLRKKYTLQKLKLLFVYRKQRRYTLQRLLRFFKEQHQHKLIGRVLLRMKNIKVCAAFLKWRADYLIVLNCHKQVQHIVAVGIKFRIFRTWNESMILHKGRCIWRSYALCRVFQSLVINRKSCINLKRWSKLRFLKYWYRRTIKKRERLQLMSSFHALATKVRAFKKLAHLASVVVNDENTTIENNRVISPAKASVGKSDISRMESTRSSAAADKIEVNRISKYVDNHTLLQKYRALLKSKLTSFEVQFGMRSQLHGGVELQRSIHRNRRTMISKIILRLRNLKLGLDQLILWCTLNNHYRNSLRLDAARRCFTRFYTEVQRVRGLKHVSKLSEEYSLKILLKRAIKKWRRRVLLKTKLRGDVTEGENFYVFNKCAVAIIVWYSSSKSQ